LKPACIPKALPVPRLQARQLQMDTANGSRVTSRRSCPQRQVASRSAIRRRSPSQPVSNVSLGKAPRRVLRNELRNNGQGRLCSEASGTSHEAPSNGGAIAALRVKDGTPRQCRYRLPFLKVAPRGRSRRRVPECRLMIVSSVQTGSALASAACFWQNLSYARLVLRVRQAGNL
jgi:hypothetical protein